MRVSAGAVFFLLGGWATACEPGGAPPPGRAEPARPGVTVPSPDSLELDLQVPDTVRIGDPVPIVLTITNRTTRRLALYLRGREITFDVTVSRPGGALVWRKLEGEVIPAIVRLEELAPGAVLTVRDSWHQRDQAGRPVPPGEYQVGVEVLTEGQPLRAPAVRLRIR